MPNFYHGTTSSAKITNFLFPPSVTGVISEKGRNKNLDKIFFTQDIGLAKIYAGRASKSIGGDPIVYKVKNPINAKQVDCRPGASIWIADYAECELFS